MTDLVQRLRDWERIYPEDQDEPDHCLYLKAAARIEELEADNKGLRHMILDQINSTGDDPEIIAATRAEWAARALMAEDRLNAASKMLPRAIIAIHKGRKQEAIDVLETVIEQLKGGSDDVF